MTLLNRLRLSASLFALLFLFAAATVPGCGTGPTAQEAAPDPAASADQQTNEGYDEDMEGAGNTEN